MTSILILNAGDATGINFCNSLRLSKKNYKLYVADSNLYNLHLAVGDERFLLPKADDPLFGPKLLELIGRISPDLLYAADTSEELEYLSNNRGQIPVPQFLPSKEAVDLYEDKWRCYNKWNDEGIIVPETYLIKSYEDLELAFSELGSIWLRATSGSGGRGSLPTDDIKLASAWIDRFEGWGRFTAAAVLTSKMATWIGVWSHGELVCHQARYRLHWGYGHLSPSGVSGITAAQSTTNEATIHKTALVAISACGFEPNGVVSVDLTFDKNDCPNPTEIQASRFYTSIFFLAKAGLNMPEIFVELGLGASPETISHLVRSLPNDLTWLKTVDAESLLIEKSVLEKNRRDWSF